MTSNRSRIYLLAMLCNPAVAATSLERSLLRAEVIRVGPTRTLKTIANAAQLAMAGATIEVDAGEYRADVAVWNRDCISVRAVGGRVHLLANGASAERAGTWVIRANGMHVEVFDFEGSAVPDRNGAGIRLEKGSLHVRDCRFLRNEMGLLTGNDPDTILEVEDCEFAYNQRPDGHNHNLYAGRIAKLSVVGSYFHHARTGHLLKSRAAVNQILYNRLTDEPGGTASYELEFANGGLAFLVGNIIEQGNQTENPHLISFGAEGYTWAQNEIYLVNNTLVNGLGRSGIYLRVAPGANSIHAVNNLLLGPGSLERAGPGRYRNNLAATSQDFLDPGAHDYRLKSDSVLVGKYDGAGRVHGQDLTPTREYAHPHGSRPLTSPAHNPGAMQTSLTHFN